MALCPTDVNFTYDVTDEVQLLRHLSVELIILSTSLIPFSVAITRPVRLGIAQVSKIGS